MSEDDQDARPSPGGPFQWCKQAIGKPLGAAIAAAIVTSTGGMLTWAWIRHAEGIFHLLQGGLGNRGIVALIGGLLGTTIAFCAAWLVERRRGKARLVPVPSEGYLNITIDVGVGYRANIRYGISIERA